MNWRKCKSEGSLARRRKGAKGILAQRRGNAKGMFLKQY